YDGEVRPLDLDEVVVLGDLSGRFQQVVHTQTAVRLLLTPHLLTRHPALPAVDGLVLGKQRSQIGRVGFEHARVEHCHTDQRHRRAGRREGRAYYGVIRRVADDPIGGQVDREDAGRVCVRHQPRWVDQGGRGVVLDGTPCERQQGEEYQAGGE